MKTIQCSNDSYEIIEGIRSFYNVSEDEAIELLILSAGQDTDSDMGPLIAEIMEDQEWRALGYTDEDIDDFYDYENNETGEYSMRPR